MCEAAQITVSPGSETVVQSGGSIETVHMLTSLLHCTYMVYSQQVDECILCGHKNPHQVETCVFRLLP